MFGNLEGAVRRGQGGKEKERTDCVQSDIRVFGIAGDWKAMALKAEVWVEAARLFFFSFFSLFGRPRAGLATV